MEVVITQLTQIPSNHCSCPAGEAFRNGFLVAQPVIANLNDNAFAASNFQSKLDAGASSFPQELLIPNTNLLYRLRIALTFLHQKLPWPLKTIFQAQFACIHFNLDKIG